MILDHFYTFLRRKKKSVKMTPRPHFEDLKFRPWGWESHPSEELAGPPAGGHFAVFWL